MLASVVDELRHLRGVTIAAASKPGSPNPKIEPYPRPATAMKRALARAAWQRRQDAHESLVARMLPHKAKAAAE